MRWAYATAWLCSALFLGGLVQAQHHHPAENPTAREAASAPQGGTTPTDSSRAATASAPHPTLQGLHVLVDRSPEPRVVEVELMAAPARIRMYQERGSDVYAYQGLVPGPILEAWEGDSVIVHFRNDLPEETTVHWHGLHLPFMSDGSPIHLVSPGHDYTYAFRLKQGSAGTYWYHPHPHHHTAHQVGKGLFGAIIVRDPNDPLPHTLTEQLLILSDNRFLLDGTIDFPDPESPQGKVDAMNGREGDVLFVNGAVMPTLRIRPGEVQRWRIINASGARIYRLALEGHSFLHVGSDGGLFEHPVEQEEILLANGERAELLVQGVGEPGSRTTLRALPYDRYMPRTRPAHWAVPRDLLTLEYADEPPVERVDVPETLRTVPRLNPNEATHTRLFLMSQGRINGRVMDLDRVDEVTTLGTTEIWEIENLVGMDHPFHLHGFSFQVLDRNGVPEPAPRWKDVVNVPKFEKVRIVVRFEDYPGKWMYHCHILDHEDQGMMGILEVR